LLPSWPRDKYHRRLMLNELIPCLVVSLDVDERKMNEETRNFRFIFFIIRNCHFGAQERMELFERDLLLLCLQAVGMPN
jgi:hypothetical protein